MKTPNNGIAASNTNAGKNYQLNPIEKIIALYHEQIALYERMLNEKNELIEKLLNRK